MTTATPTLNELLDAVAAVIEDRGPDFRYEGFKPNDEPVETENDQVCFYSEDAGVTGSCVFGAAFIEKLGIEWGEDWEGRAISDLADSLGLTLTGSEDALLDKLQATQDAGKPYSEVKKVLDKYRAG